MNGHKFIPKILFTFSIIILLLSCEKEDESFHQISQIETKIHNLINDYRDSKGLNKLVLQPLLFKEARIHSDRMANGMIEVGGETIGERFDAVKEKIGGTSEGWVVLATDVAIADSITERMLSEQATTDIISQEYTQSGVGVSYDEDGIAYVTHMFLLIPNN